MNTDKLRELLTDYYKTEDYTASLSKARTILREHVPALLARLDELEAVAQHSALLLPYMRPYAEESICGDLERALAALGDDQ